MRRLHGTTARRRFPPVQPLHRLRDVRHRHVPVLQRRRRESHHYRELELLYDVVATAELDAARTPPSTDAEECDDADALALMALSRS